MNGRVGDYFTRFKDSFARERPYNDTQIDEKQHILLLTAPNQSRLPAGPHRRSHPRTRDQATVAAEATHVWQVG